LNSAQVKKSAAMVNFNLLVWHTTVWGSSWYQKRWSMWLHPTNMKGWEF